MRQDRSRSPRSELDVFSSFANYDPFCQSSRMFEPQMHVRPARESRVRVELRAMTDRVEAPPDSSRSLGCVGPGAPAPTHRSEMQVDLRGLYGGLPSDIRIGGPGGQYAAIGVKRAVSTAVDGYATPRHMQCHAMPCHAMPLSAR